MSDCERVGVGERESSSHQWKYVDNSVFHGYPDLCKSWHS